MNVYTQYIYIYIYVSIAMIQQVVHIFTIGFQMVRFTANGVTSPKSMGVIFGGILILDFTGQAVYFAMLSVYYIVE